MGKPVDPLLGEGLVAIALRVAPRDVVFVRAILEAHEGLGTLFATSGGEVTLATTPSQLAAREELVRDLAREVTVLSTSAPVLG